MSWTQQQPSASVLPGNWSSKRPAVRVRHKLPEDLPSKNLNRDQGPAVQRRGDGRNRGTLSAIWWEPLRGRRQSSRGLSHRAQRYGLKLMKMWEWNGGAGRGDGFLTQEWQLLNLNLCVPLGSVPAAGWLIFNEWMLVVVHVLKLK